MSVRELIINYLQVFVDEFKNARARYEYDSLAEVHTIEICPQSVYDSIEFLSWESSMFDDFIKIFPGEVVGFISEDAVVGIKSADYAIEGIEYAPFNTDPYYFFDVQSVNIIQSNIIQQKTTLSISDNKDRNCFDATIVTNHDLNNNYKLAA